MALWRSYERRSAARLEDELKHNQEEDLKEKMIGRLIEAHSFAPPPTMMERQTRYLMERYQNRGSGQGVPATSFGRGEKKFRRACPASGSGNIVG